MDQFDKETNKSHYCKAYCCCHGNLLELCKITKRKLVRMSHVWHTYVHCRDQRRGLSLQNHVNTGNSSKSAQMLRNKPTFLEDRRDFQREDADFHKEWLITIFFKKAESKIPTMTIHRTFIPSCFLYIPTSPENNL